MKRTIAFPSKGTTCRGLLYLPDGARSGAGLPTIVLAHGFSAVKEMYFTHFAEHFARSGFAALLFDYRCQGESDGEPRGQIFPWEQIEDFRSAISFATQQPEVDPRRIGIFGSSYSGGHVICIGALDRRVKCVACQVPLVDGRANLQAIVTREAAAGLIQALEADRLQRFLTGAVNYVPVVAEDANCALPTRDSFAWFTTTAREMAPRWENRVTLESIEKFIEYSPAVYLPRISPTPFLMMVAAGDVLTPYDLAIAAFEKALQPKKLVILPGGHFDAYTKGFSLSSGNATAFFREHLGA